MIMQTIEITLEQDLLVQLEELVASLQVSPSEVITLALERLIKRRRNEEITQQINDAYASEYTEEEQDEANDPQGACASSLPQVHTRKTNNE